MSDGPKLLVEWSSPWREFVTSIRPALRRSPEKLAGEARTSIFPVLGMSSAWLLELLLLFLIIVLPDKLAWLHPYNPPPIPHYDVIYYSGDELPQTSDKGGARHGRSGRSGGREAFHRTQTIRVARGESLTERVVDAPRLNLPRTLFPVANLLAIEKSPGPPPLEGVRSSLAAANLPKIAPVPPPPETSRDALRLPTELVTSVVPPTVLVPPREMPAARFPVFRSEIVPPTVSAPEQERTTRAALTLPQQSVVAPPPTLSREVASTAGIAMNLTQHDVVPPPVSVNPGSATNRNLPGLNTPVVPPPPSLSGGSSATARGLGSNGRGLGSLGDLGSIAAPPNSGGGNSTNSAAVISSRPGARVGAPATNVGGALALSPAGGNAPGLGGSGGGAGIGNNGAGPGSGKTGEEIGAGKSGTGLGADGTARTGTSLSPGAGGAGSGVHNNAPSVPGISVQGGNVVNLPSFGAGANDPTAVGRSPIGSNRSGPAITVVATSRSGGAFNFYGALKGDRVYSIYVDTILGTAVLQFSDPSSVSQPYGEDLTAPGPLRTELPAARERTRLVISCVIDRSGAVKAIKVLEGGKSPLAAKIAPALLLWKFTPAARGSQPVEVDAILGFNIDTR